MEGKKNYSNRQNSSRTVHKTPFGKRNPNKLPKEHRPDPKTQVPPPGDSESPEEEGKVGPVYDRGTASDVTRKEWTDSATRSPGGAGQVWRESPSFSDPRRVPSPPLETRWGSPPVESPKRKFWT